MMETDWDRVREIAEQDAEVLEDKDRQYGSSWRRRGGVGAFMMAARKWDRIETAIMPHPEDPTRANGSTVGRPVAPWDIFGAVAADQRDEGILDDIRDLRRYLLLIEEATTAPSPDTVPATAALDRYPINATNHEYTDYTKMQVRGGSRDGTLASLLYRRAEKTDSTVHPYTMHEAFRAEYGY